jgi:hypothetical protein
MVSSETSKKDVESSKILFGFKDDQKVGISLIYKKNEPELNFNICEHQGIKIVDAYFPLNNSLFDPELTQDGKIDETEVRLAKIN